jgi:hypothetical protein
MMSQRGCNQFISCAPDRFLTTATSLQKKGHAMQPFVRRIGTFLLWTLFVSLMTETASAQFPRFNRRLFGTVPVENLARLEVVQTAVGINDDQKKLIQEMNVKRNTESMGLFQSANGDFDAIHKGVLKMNVEYFAKLIAVLDEKQQKRITEIYYQVNNGNVLVDEPVVKLLKITDEQAKTLQKVLDDARGKVFETFQSLQGKPEEERLKIQNEMVEGRDRELLALLTEEQRNKFDKAKGEKLVLDLDKLPPFGQ